MASALTLVAAGLGIVLLPASLQNVRVTGVVYRPLRARMKEAAAAKALIDYLKAPDAISVIKKQRYDAGLKQLSASRATAASIRDCLSRAR